MKNLLLFIALTFVLNTYCQNIEGTYTNGVGQKLVISNAQDCCFDFKIIWGINDEWSCLFEGEGIAEFSDVNSAFYGESSEYPDIQFTITGNTISILGGYMYIGDDCAKFGDSAEETYTKFKK